MTSAEATQLKTALDNLAAGFLASAPIRVKFRAWKADIDGDTNGLPAQVTEIVGDAVVADIASTVALLPQFPASGQEAIVTDALAPVIGSTVAGGGAVRVMVSYNGTNWIVE